MGETPPILFNVTSPTLHTSETAGLHVISFTMREERIQPLFATLNQFLKDFPEQFHRGDIFELKAEVTPPRSIYSFGLLLLPHTRHIFNGWVLQPLDFRSDPPYRYFELPCEFSIITEFPINYWYPVLGQKCLLKFNPRPYLGEILGKLTSLNQWFPDWWVTTFGFPHGYLQTETVTYLESLFGKDVATIVTGYLIQGHVLMIQSKDRETIENKFLQDPWKIPFESIWGCSIPSSTRKETAHYSLYVNLDESEDDGGFSLFD